MRSFRTSASTNLPFNQGFNKPTSVSCVNNAQGICCADNSGRSSKNYRNSEGPMFGITQSQR